MTDARHAWESFRTFTQSLAQWWFRSSTFCERRYFDSIFYPCSCGRCDGPAMADQGFKEVTHPANKTVQ